MNAPRLVMHAARDTGGTIERALTRFDHERGCRVLELTVTWPGDEGYGEQSKFTLDEISAPPLAQGRVMADSTERA